MHKNLIKFVTLVGIGVSLLGAGSVTAHASKYYEGHFDSKRITYHIDSTSKHYRGIWKAAIKDWNKQGVVKLVNTKKKSKANIRMTTMKHVKGSGDSESLVTSRFLGDNVFSSANVKLDRTKMANHHYKDIDRIILATGNIGTALGLKDNNNRNSIMGDTSNTITSFDRANLKAAYKGVK